MWEFPGGPSEGNRYFVLGLGAGQPTADLVDLTAPTNQDDDLIAYGPLLSDDGATWLGTAALLRAPGPDAARATVLAIPTPPRPADSGYDYAAVEVHNWRFGGRS